MLVCASRQIDTQGYECKVLLGSMSALRHKDSHVEVLVAEVARKHLAAHCCKPGPSAWRDSKKEQRYREQRYREQSRERARDADVTKLRTPPAPLETRTQGCSLI